MKMADNKETLCPIYSEIAKASPWKNAKKANAGLVFEKFPDAWIKVKHEKGKFEFNKNEWLKTWDNSYGDDALLKEACQRQKKMVEILNGKIITIANISRFVTGLGCIHPVENGFTWHRTLGVPYLPGSGLKGLLRSWLREEREDCTFNEKEKCWEESEKIQKWFGTGKQAGKFILSDMLPTTRPRLTVEIMTPHYGPYYKEGLIPGDWYDPVPIPFLVVRFGVQWQLGVLPGSKHRTVDPKELEEIKSSLLSALEILGAGAKTASGYGRFCLLEDIKNKNIVSTDFPGTETEKFRYDRKEEVTIKRIEDSKKGKHRYEADDGIKGQFSGETPPAIAVGDKTKAWIANICGKTYTFTMREPKKCKK
jgi:CRISPR-associated protein Cmr6